MGYWRKVFARAWADTKHSLGWNQKTVWAVLLAAVSIAVTFFQLGLAATVASATAGAALSSLIAGLVLFVWNFFSAPANLYTELSRSSGQKIAALETELAELKEPPPDYAAIRHIDRMTLRVAAFYWCDLSPGYAMPSNVQQWYGALASAVTRGELNFEPEYHSLGSHNEMERAVQKRNPKLDTIVTRKSLQAFAKKHGYDPKFLRD
jgi:hypothetical protein